MFVSFGVGAVGIAVGSVFGLMTLNEKSDADKQCDAQTKVCNAQGKSKIDTATTYGWVSTAGFGVGIVGAALGTYFLLTTPSASASGAAHVTARLPIMPTINRDGAGAAYYTTF